MMAVYVYIWTPLFLRSFTSMLICWEGVGVDGEERRGGRKEVKEKGREGE